MKAIILAAILAVCHCAKLDRRSNEPPASAKTAGGSSDILQTPKVRNQELPIGSYENEHEGVIVDAAVGTRASQGPSGLGAARKNYGSKDSRVGEAAFRDKHLQGGSSFVPQGFEDHKVPERIQANRDRNANIVKIEKAWHPASYNYVYETDNGISAGENAISAGGVKAQGGYSYTGDDGKVYQVTYVADEGGYRPQGAHLPTPHPIPLEIQKALEQNARDEAAGIIDDGSYDPKKYNVDDYSDSDNGRYNDRQSNEVNRPGSNSQTGSFNANNKFFTPNNNGQNGFNNFQFTKLPKPSSIPTRPSFTFGQQNQFANPALPQGSKVQTVFHPANTFQYNKPNQNQMNKEYLPPFSQQLHQNIVTNKKPTTTSIPLSQQSLQNEYQKPNMIFSSRPSSYAPISEPFTTSTSETKPDKYQQTSLKPNKDFDISSFGQNTENNFGGLTSTRLPLNNQFISTTNNDASTVTTAETLNPTITYKEPTSTVNALATQETVFGTKQPSRELTTPFMTNPYINSGSSPSSTSVPSSDQPTFSTSLENLNTEQPSLQFSTQSGSLSIHNMNKPFTQQTDSSENQASTTYQGEVYQYNTPTTSQTNSGLQTPTTQDFATENDKDNQKQTTLQFQTVETTKGEIYNYQKPTPTQNIQTINTPLATEQTDASINQVSTTNQGELYQYNTPSVSQASSDLQTPSTQEITTNYNEKDFGKQTTPQFQPVETTKGEIYNYQKPSPTQNTQTINTPLATEQTDISENQASTTYEGELYQYNTPTVSQTSSELQTPTTQGFTTNQSEKDFEQKQTTIQFKPVETTKEEIYNYPKPTPAAPTLSHFSTQSTQTQTHLDISTNTANTNTPHMPEEHTAVTNGPGNYYQSTHTAGTTQGLEESTNTLSTSIGKQTTQQESTFTTLNDNKGEIYQYNKPSSLPNNFMKGPNTMISTQSNQFNQPQSTLETIAASTTTSQNTDSTHTSFPGGRPTDVTFVTSTQDSSFNQYTQPSTNLNTEAFFSQNPVAHNKRPVQNYRPTAPSFPQTTFNQFHQPQGPDGSYYYDRPSKPFLEQFPTTLFSQDKFTHPPQQMGHFSVSNNFPQLQPVFPTVPTHQFQNNNNGVLPSRAPALTTVPSNSHMHPPSNHHFNFNFQTKPQPDGFSTLQPNFQQGSTFAQAIASTQQFPTFPNLKPQHTNSPTTAFNTYNGEVYQYNKPNEVSPTQSMKNEEAKIEAAPINGQLKPQFIVNLDDKGTVVNKINFQPSNKIEHDKTQNGQDSVNLPATMSENKQEEQKPSSRPLGSTILGSPCCRSSFNQHQNSPLEEKSPEANDKAHSSLPKGEHFDPNRKPPSFDSTGYHY